jgi:MoaA/NifB/PqqE/SkfB family radical SAM enzyme
MQPASELRPDPELKRLPLVTLYLSERCNSRCVSCDYWRHGSADMNLAAVRLLLPDLMRLHTEVALLSGGEPLLNPEWEQIAQTLREAGLKLWLLTSGLSLAKHARRAAALFDTITVSLDGTNRDTYSAIRGLDAFEKVCEGIRAAAHAGARVTVRVTLQHANFRELPRFVDLVRDCGVRQISFLAVDVANPHVFGRTDDFTSDLALTEEELPEFSRLLDDLEREYAEDFRRGFIAESPRKLRRLAQYFSAVRGRGSYPPVHCNAPEYSAVIDARANVRPCFFIPGTPEATLAGAGALEPALNNPAMSALRAAIRAGERPECTTCVCPLWRDVGDASTLLPAPVAALRGA